MRPSIIHRMLFFAALFPASCGNQVKDLHDGILLVSWTIRGAAATPDACQGIDHLELNFSPDRAADLVRITPIDCPRDVPFRYDGLPAGTATVELVAVSQTGGRVADGIGRVKLETKLSLDMATAIDLH